MTGGAPILLDVTRLIWRQWVGRRPTGIDRVCLAYLAHFGDRAQAVVQHRNLRRILNPDASGRLFRLLEERPRDFRRRFVVFIAREMLSKGDQGRERLYLNLGHTGLDDPGLHQWLQRANVRPVYFVHDLIPLHHPEYCRPGEQQRHRHRMRTVLETGNGVIGNSRATLDALAAFADEQGLARPPMLAAWLGTPMFEKAAKIPPPERATFVVLGTIEARKNHLMLLKLWSRMINRLGSSAPRLLIIGQRGWEAREVHDMLDDLESLGDHVVELGECSDAELAGRLLTARALLFPSMVEGYGLPLIEAFELGVPVIASDLPVLREIGSDVPLFLDPTDESAWEQAILAFADPGSVARETQVRRLKSYHPPTWEVHFAAVEQWLPSLSSHLEATEDRVDQYVDGRLAG